MYYISIIIKVFAFRVFYSEYKGAQLGQFYLNYIYTLYIYIRIYKITCIIVFQVDS